MNYRVGLDYETLNKRYFPTKGSDMHAGYTLYTDCRSASAFSALDARIKKVFLITRSTVLIPMLYGRFILDDPDLPSIYGNIVGGEGYNMRFEQQLPFSGINYLEKAGQILACVQLKIQQQIIKKHFVSLAGNYAVNNDNLPELFQGEHIYGTSLGYGYESPFGPVEAFFNYSNRTEHLGFYLNIGFGF